MSTPTRILMVLHDFLPQSVAGTELYVQRVAQQLSRTCKVALFYSIRDLSISSSSASGNRFRQITMNGLTQFQVVVNTPWPPLKQTLTAPDIERAYQDVLHSFKPDWVHFHHLAFLPLALAERTRQAGIPYGVTLHDYYLACPAGGQLAAHPDGNLCAAPIPERCAHCYSEFQTRAGVLSQLVQVGASALHGVAGTARRLTRQGLNLAGGTEPGPEDSLWSEESRPAMRLDALIRRVPPALRAGLERVNPRLPVPPDLVGILRRQHHARALLNGAEWVVSPSKDLALRLSGWGWPVRRWKILPNPGPAWRIRAALPPPVPLKLLYLGTLARHKGLDRILAAVRAFPDRCMQLDVCGNPLADPGYATELYRNRTSSVSFSGPCPPEEVPARLAEAHALILGARWPENAPLTVLEAHAAGRPVIAPHIGGLPELIRHGVDGLLYDPSEPSGLQAVLGDLLEEPSRLWTLAEQVRPPISVEEHAQELLVLYARPQQGVLIKTGCPDVVRFGVDSQAQLPPDALTVVPRGNSVELSDMAQLGADLYAIKDLKAYTKEYLLMKSGPWVSILIPTKNGGMLLKELLNTLVHQQTPWPFELLLLDSGSADDVLAYARALSCPAHVRIRCYQIPPESFQHGRTRNWMAALARAPLLVYMVQDATPLGVDWLRTLADAFTNSSCVGGYARQEPRPEADPGLQGRLAARMPALEAVRIQVLAPGQDWLALTPEQRLHLSTFDNVCSIMWRSTLLMAPFPEVAFGEDLAWGSMRIREGRALAYVSTASVCHSHQRSFWHDLQRSHVEHRQLGQLVGLQAIRSPGMVAYGLLSLFQDCPRLGAAGTSRQLAELLGQTWSAIEAELLLHVSDARATVHVN